MRTVGASNQCLRGLTLSARPKGPNGPLGKFWLKTPKPTNALVFQFREEAASGLKVERVAGDSHSLPQFQVLGDSDRIADGVYHLLVSEQGVPGSVEIIVRVQAKEEER